MTAELNVSMHRRAGGIGAALCRGEFRIVSELAGRWRIFASEHERSDSTDDGTFHRTSLKQVDPGGFEWRLQHLDLLRPGPRAADCDHGSTTTCCSGWGLRSLVPPKRMVTATP